MNDDVKLPPLPTPDATVYGPSRTVIGHAILVDKVKAWGREVIALNAAPTAEIEKAEPWSSIKYLLDSYPGSIRVRPGGGAEEMLGSLCVTFIKLREADAAYRSINTPEIVDFLAAVRSEALHQRERWAATGDAGKSDADWFWLIGYLAGKAIRPDATPEKQLHHIITTAAACLNWHGARVGAYLEMRPGIEGPRA